MLLEIAILILAWFTGCSIRDGTNPAEPVMHPPAMGVDGSRMLWGYYEFFIDPIKGEVSIVPLRDASKHFNALRFMETESTTKESIESPPQFGEGKLKVDVYDWQGFDSVDAVYMQAPDFFEGEIELGNPVDNGGFVNFDPETFEILGQANFLALQEITTF